jgi:hypothetical protein
MGHALLLWWLKQTEKTEKVLRSANRSHVLLFYWCVLLIAADCC